MTPITTQTLENALTAKLMVSFGKTAAEATDGEMMRRPVRRPASSMPGRCTTCLWSF